MRKNHSRNNRVILDSVSCPATLSSAKKASSAPRGGRRITRKFSNSDFETPIPEIPDDIPEESGEDEEETIDESLEKPPTPEILTVRDENTYEMDKRSGNGEKATKRSKLPQLEQLPPQPQKQWTRSRYTEELTSELTPNDVEAEQQQMKKHTRTNNKGKIQRAKQRRQRNFSRHHAQSSLVSSYATWEDSSVYSMGRSMVTTASVIATRPSWGHYVVGLFVFLGWTLHHAYHDSLHQYFRTVRMDADAAGHSRMYDNEQYLRGRSSSGRMTVTENGYPMGNNYKNINAENSQTTANSGELVKKYGLSSTTNIRDSLLVN